MRVRCVSTTYARGIETNNALSLTVGREYTVLWLQAAAESGIRFRVLTDDGDLAIFHSTLFEVTDNRLSRLWRCRLGPGETVDMAPPAWFSIDWEIDPRAVATHPDDVVHEVVAADTQTMLSE